MSKNKRLVRLIVRVTPQTAWHIRELTRLCGYREPGRVIDKLVRDKAVQMRGTMRNPLWLLRPI